MDPYNDKFLQFGSPPPAPQSNWDKFKTIMSDAVGYLAPPPPKAETVKNAAVGIGKALLPPDPYEEAGKMVQQVRQGDYLGAAETGWGSLPMQGGIRAYHGSPHSFDRFSTKHIGSGEGAQAYGHGLYFTDTEDVAKAYKRDLANKIDVNGKPLLHNNKQVGTTGNRVIDDILMAHNGDVEAAIADELAYRKTLTPEQLANSRRGDPLPALEALRGKVSVANDGHMYEVEINANPEDFLDWDKPLKGQTAWSKIAKDWGGEEQAAERLGIDPSVATGRQYLSALSPQLTGASYTGASQRMLGQGVPGIKYLDQMSRGAGEGSRNYVVFDDKMVNILRKYGFVPFGLAGVPYGGGGEEQK